VLWGGGTNREKNPKKPRETLKEGPPAKNLTPSERVCGEAKWAVENNEGEKVCGRQAPRERSVNAARAEALEREAALICRDRRGRNEKTRLIASFSSFQPKEGGLSHLKDCAGLHLYPGGLVGPTATWGKGRDESRAFNELGLL